jgi:hypothetical protein
VRTIHSGIGLAVGLWGCGHGAAPVAPAPAALSHAESIYAATYTLKDRLDIAGLRALPESAAALRPRYLAARRDLVGSLAIDSTTLRDSSDRRALTVMRSTLAEELADNPQTPEGAAPVDATRCGYDARAIADTDSLAARLYDCYGAAAHAVPVDGESLERLTVLGLLGVTRRHGEAAAAVSRPEPRVAHGQCRR